MRTLLLCAWDMACNGETFSNFNQALSLSKNNLDLHFSANISVVGFQIERVIGIGQIFNIGGGASLLESKVTAK